MAEAKKAEFASTGINGISADNASVAEAYTIGGVRVDAKAAKGIVIIGRKKVVKQ